MRGYRRTHRQRISFSWLWLVAGCAAQHPGQADGGDGPELLPVGQTILEESDTLYIGGLGKFAVAEDGRIAVIDRFPRHVVVYTPEGRPTQVIGRLGRGPGEFVAPAAVEWVGDSLLAVGEFSMKRLLLFQADSGEFLWDLPLGGYVNALQYAGKKLWLANYSLDRFTGASVVDLQTASIRHLLEIPYRRGSQMSVQESSLMLLHRGTGLLAAFSGRPRLLLTDLEGRVMDSVLVPVRHRRGMPSDYEAIVEEGDQVRSISAASFLMRGSVMENGSVLLVHYDQDWVEKAFRAKIYASILNPGLDSACVDAEIPASGEVRAEVYARGDTLLVLDQQSGDGPRLTTTISKYLVRTDNCTWLPTDRAWHK